MSERNLSPEQFAYQGGHRPAAEGAPLHDITAGTFPRDAYDTLHHYTHSGSTGPSAMTYDRESAARVQAARGKPERSVTVYRAAPEGTTHINPGDWVAISRSYASQHAAARRSADAPQAVYSAKVPAAHVRSGGNDIIEWGYGGSTPVAARRLR